MDLIWLWEKVREYTIVCILCSMFTLCTFPWSHLWSAGLCPTRWCQAPGPGPRTDTTRTALATWDSDSHIQFWFCTAHLPICKNSSFLPEDLVLISAPTWTCSMGRWSPPRPWPASPSPLPGRPSPRRSTQPCPASWRPAPDSFHHFIISTDYFNLNHLAGFVNADKAWLTLLCSGVSGRTVDSLTVRLTWNYEGRF